MGIIQDIGHLILPVDDMSKAVAFYRDLLGFRLVGEGSPVWTVIQVPVARSLSGARTSSPRSRTGPIEKIRHSGSTSKISGRRPVSSSHKAFT